MELTIGECISLSRKATVSIARENTTPNKLIRASFFLPVLSMKYMLRIEPNAFRPDVMSDRRSAVLLECKTCQLNNGGAVVHHSVDPHKLLED